MEKIIPRWEWRTFGIDLGAGETEVRLHPADKTRESREIYILSANSNDNTKIRDELMDIKTLLRVNPDGLEQWSPIMKAAFPIHITDLALVFKAFNIPIPFLNGDEFSYDTYMNQIIGSQRDLKPVNVFKRRTGFTINNCIVEIAQVEFNTQGVSTIAVEHTDPQLVMQTVRELKLTQYENVNYIKAMKQVVGWDY